MVKFILFSFTLLLPSFCFADPSFLAGVQSLYGQTRSWQASFDQSTDVALINQKIAKAGKLWIQKPGKLRIEYAGEGARTYVSDGERLWILSPNKKETVVNKKISKLVDRQALVFLNGLGELTRDFRVREVKGAPRGLRSLELIPKEESSLQKIILGVDAKTFLVQNLELWNASGNKTLYRFKDIKLNTPVPAAYFKGGA